MKNKKVIVAVSLEDETLKSLNKIKDLNLGENVEIQLVHVVPIVLYARGMNLSLITYPAPEEREKVEAVMISRLQEVQKEYFSDYKNVTLKCLFDSNTKSAFTDYVQKEDPGLVVIATRGRHGLKNFFDSSFAQHQLKYSPAPVLIVR